MFDQKWLKRYMLQNRPNGGEDVAAALPGGPPKPQKTAEPGGKKPAMRPADPESGSAGGEQAEIVTAYDITCPRCGNVYKSDAHICRQCGHKRSEASVVVPRPPGAEGREANLKASLANGRGPAPAPAAAPAPGRMYSQGSYPPGQQRSAEPYGNAPPPNGFAQSRYFTPEGSGNKGYGGARPSDAPPPGYAPSPQNFPRSMSHRSDAQPPQNPLARDDASGEGRVNYFAKGGDYGMADPMQASGAGNPLGGAPWPMLGNSFMGAYGQFPYDANANMHNMNMFPGQNYGEERQNGARNYVVLCKDDVEVRASPTYSDDARIGHLLHPGQVVVIDERRMVNGSWFLHLADGRGWVFESIQRLLVMTEVQDFERGLWHYFVACEDDVETRISPTYSDDARTGIILSSGSTAAIDERCRVAGARFLKLADGRGWVFETRDRLLVFSEVRSKPQEARDFERGLWHYTVVCDDDVEIRAAPTYSDEARTGLMVHPGDCVAIDERCRVAAVWYLRLSDGRGWVFESKDSRRVMMQLH